MKKTRILAAMFATPLALLLSFSSIANGGGAQASKPTNTPPAATAKNHKLLQAYGQLPLRFEVNEGQADRQVKFISRGAGQTLFLTSSEAVLTSRSRNPVRMKLLSAKPDAKVAGFDPLAGRSNYFLGNDPANWLTNVPTFAKVRYSNIYPGATRKSYSSSRWFP